MCVCVCVYDVVCVDGVSVCVDGVAVCVDDVVCVCMDDVPVCVCVRMCGWCGCVCTM